MLVGIYGKAGAGKDTIGDHLVNQYGFHKIALADPIKRIVKDVFVLDDHTVYDREAREQPLEDMPEWSVRKLLQYIGTELFRENIDDAIWVKSLWKRIKNDPNNNYVVTDLRFPNELDYFKDRPDECEFISIKVIRPGCDGNVGLAGHASEAHDLDCEYDLTNDSDIEHLEEKVRVILAERMEDGFLPYWEGNN